MQGEEAYPSGDMDGILVRMITVPGDLIWDVVDHDDGIEEKQYDKKHEEEGKIVKKHRSSTG